MIPLKTIKTAAFFLLASLIPCSNLLSVSISNYLVDGVMNNTEVVVQGRAPIFSWEYTANEMLFVSTFTLKVSTQSARPFTTTIWSVNTTTDSTNTSVLDEGVFRTSLKFNLDSAASQTLAYNTTYYWDLTLYDSSGTAISIASPGSFVTIISSVVFTGVTYDLQVDYNNPFNPSKGQITKFRYIVKDRNKPVKVRIYNLSGFFIKTLVNGLTALQNREYTLVWDGKDDTGAIVPSGIYLVNMDVGESKGITRKIIVKKK